MQQEPIALFGDYDADGAASTALMAAYLRALGVDPQIRIPDRLREGYGPSIPAFTDLVTAGARLIITLDCGSTAAAPLAFVAKRGVDVMVLDHHSYSGDGAPAVALVNPNRPDQPQLEQGEIGALAAVGVTFMALVATNRALRQANWFGATTPEPDLRQWLDLVAVGTVADVVPLVGLNRALVAAGIKRLTTDPRGGLAALMATAGVGTDRIDAQAIAFNLAPRLNAGGRLGDSALAARLLCSADQAEQTQAAQQLDSLNRERRAMEAEQLPQALAACEEQLVLWPDCAVLMVADERWHVGIVGIIAGRLKDRLHRPIVVMAADEQGVLRGSGRSILGIDLGAAIRAAGEAGLTLAGGGHPMAAGLSVHPDQIDALRRYLHHHALKQVGGEMPSPRSRYDITLRLPGARLDLVRALKRLGPFGSGNPTPVVRLAGCRIARMDPVGQGHWRMFLTDETGSRLKAIAFRVDDGPLADVLIPRGPALDLLVELDEDTWGGTVGVQARVIDVVAAA
jgi:single-stranded-DNA-specific exonuclease